jgi:maltose/moltooligosaccharide transporter
MGFALQNSNVSRIFQTLGAILMTSQFYGCTYDRTHYSTLLVISLIERGQKLVCRKPYFLGVISHLLPYSCLTHPVLWIAAGMLWIMDASINVSMEPFRAFVGDSLPEKQRTMGFAMQSFLSVLAHQNYH